MAAIRLPASVPAVRFRCRRAADLAVSPGGTREAYELAKPFLEKWAAKDAQGNACERYIGPGGAGSFVKTVHNGIEQGLLSAIWYASISGCSADQAAKCTRCFDGPMASPIAASRTSLRLGTATARCAATSCAGHALSLADLTAARPRRGRAALVRGRSRHTADTGSTEGDGIRNSDGIVDDVKDKVVQDTDDTEGTGVWTAGACVPCASLT